MNNEIIKLLKISKKFFQSKKDIVVLKNINLKINKGELISLTGLQVLENLLCYI